MIQLPKSRAEIRRIQSERKRVAVEQALRSPFWQKRIPKNLSLKDLDDPEVWRRIPVLDKDDLLERYLKAPDNGALAAFAREQLPMLRSQVKDAERTMADK